MLANKLIKEMSKYSAHRYTYLSIILIMININTELKAQQIPTSSHFYKNPLIYNPAFTGNEDYTRTFFLARKQWLNIQGAPETYLFTLDGSVNEKKVGLGLKLFSDITGIIGRTGGYGTYRYKINFNNEHLLYMGLSAGFLQNKIHFDKIRAQNINETTILKNTEKQTVFDVNLGLGYQYKNWKIGIATFQLFNNRHYYEGIADIQSLNYNLIRHFIGTIQYRYSINNDFRLDPQLIIKNVQGMPLQFDLGTYINWRDQGWLGINYQHHYGVSISVGGVMHDQYTLSYSYDIATGNISNFSGGTHEFLIGIRIYSQEDQYQRNRLKRKEMNHLKRLSQEQYEQIEKLEEENKQLKTKMDSTVEDVSQQKIEIQKLKDIYKKDRPAIKRTIEKYQISLDELDKMELSRETSNKLFYIVLGAYLTIKDAKYFQQVLQREAGLDTKVFQRSDGKYFFVYSNAFQQGNETKKAIKRELRLINRLNLDEYINGNVWIYHAKPEDLGE